jgi:hypothetical protein
MELLSAVDESSQKFISATNLHQQLSCSVLLMKVARNLFQQRICISN